MLELTVPWEERMKEANEWKRGKYEELAKECRRWGDGPGACLVYSNYFTITVKQT